MLGVQAAACYSQGFQALEARQGQEVGIQGQAGIRHLPNQGQEGKQEEARSQG